MEYKTKSEVDSIVESIFGRPRIAELTCSICGWATYIYDTEDGSFDRAKGWLKGHRERHEKEKVNVESI